MEATRALAIKCAISDDASHFFHSSLSKTSPVAPPNHNRPESAILLHLKGGEHERLMSSTSNYHSGIAFLEGTLEICIFKNKTLKS